MQKYRKKPIVIEAMEITEDLFTDPHPNDKHIVGLVYDPLAKQVHIKTLMGTMSGGIGDFIIHGLKDEYYPCQKEVFEASYELAE